MRWEEGRQKTGYLVTRLFQSAKLRADCWLIYYPTGSYILAHTDSAPGFKHYRLNIDLRKAKKGGKLKCEEPIFRFWRFNFFRSDRLHFVTEVREGTRLVLSVGWLRRE